MTDGKRAPRKKLRLGLGAQVIVGMGLGVIFGMVLKAWGAPASLVDAMAIPGDVFIGGIKMVVVPLVLVAVTLGIAGNDDVTAVRKIGVSIVLYFLATTAFAVTVGSLLTVLIDPGSFIDPQYRDTVMSGAKAVEVSREVVTLREQVKGLMPKGLFFDLANGNMLQVVLLASLLGAAILALKGQEGKYGLTARRMIEAMEFLQEVIMRVVMWALLLAPIGVFGMMANVTAKVGLDAILSVAVYVGVVLLALLVLLALYAVIVLSFGRRSPFAFFKSIRELQVMAFSTSSSAAVMPMSLRTAEHELGVHPSVSRFIVPLGATINMDGTATYQAAAALFLMQVFGVEITVASVLAILGTALLASIGTPGTPGVGIVVLAGILESNGVPGSGIALIFGVDRILDMCRTTINVTGDQTACIVMERLAGRKLRSLEGDAGPAGAAAPESS